MFKGRDGASSEHHGFSCSFSSSLFTLPVNENVMASVTLS